MKGPSCPTDTILAIHWEKGVGDGIEGVGKTRKPGARTTGLELLLPSTCCWKLAGLGWTLKSVVWALKRGEGGRRTQREKQAFRRVCAEQLAVLSMNLPPRSLCTRSDGTTA